MTPRTDYVGGFEQRLRLLRSAFEKEFPASAHEVIFGGTKMTLAEVQTLLQQVEESFVAVHLAVQALRDAVAARRKRMKQNRSTYDDAVLFLKHYLGKSNPRLLQAGVALTKARRPLTAEERAIAQARAAATRKLRGTMGRRQREAQEKAAGPSVQVFGLDGKPLDGPAQPAKPDSQPSNHE